VGLLDPQEVCLEFNLVWSGENIACLPPLLGVAAACSLSSSMRNRDSLGVVPLDGASVTEPYCGQNDREDRRDEEVLHDSYSRTELGVIWHRLSPTDVMAVTKEWNSETTSGHGPRCEENEVKA